MSSAAPSPVEIEFPSSDGKPMAESDAQAIPLMYAVTGLRDHFRRRSDVYVSGNLLIYYDPNDSGASVAPDVFVVKGVSNRKRPSYKVWEEGKTPDFVLEITSRTTRGEDEGRKRELYRELGVTEYWRYDPTGDYLLPVLRGLVLRYGEYAELPAEELVGGDLRMSSEVLGLELRVEGGELRLHDPHSGRDVRTLTESNEACARAEEGWQREKRERREAEARIAELEALLRRAGSGEADRR